MRGIAEGFEWRDWVDGGKATNVSLKVPLQKRGSPLSRLLFRSFLFPTKDPRLEDLQSSIAGYKSPRRMGPDQKFQLGK